MNAVATVKKETITKLRERTSAGIMECKEALKEADGDLERAIDVLRKKGASLAKKKSGRATREGLVTSYIHHGGRVGVLIEVACETDFVARTSDFQTFVQDIAMQVAAASPHFVSRDEVPSEVVEREKGIFQSQIKGKPENIVEKILEGKLEKFYQEACLLEQPFIKNQDLSIQAYLTEIIAKLGENIVVRRFTRYEIGS